MDAGFDGVELHAANGYLLNQFLEDGSNHRVDAYGGSFQNRARLLMEVVESVKSAIGAGRLGVRLSPFGIAGGMSDSNPTELYKSVITELSQHSLAYLHLIEARASGMARTDVMRVDALNNAKLFGHLFRGQVISAATSTPKARRLSARSSSSCTNARTSWPPARSSRTALPPVAPVAPVTKIFEFAMTCS